MCNKALQKGAQKQAGEDADNIYCVGCYGGLFGPEGFRGGGAGLVAVARNDFAGANAVRCDCGADVTGRKFCGECGAKVVAKPVGHKEAAPKAAAPKKTFCGECGAKAGAGKFCNECGAGM